jgi:hypothetical protein
LAAPTSNRITSGERLGQTRDRVTGWADYITHPQVAQPGSSLAKDDTLFGVLPPSHLAWQGILSAVDHLDTFFGCSTAAGRIRCRPARLHERAFSAPRTPSESSTVPTAPDDRSAGSASRTRSSSAIARW